MTDRQRSPGTPTRRPAGGNPQSAPAGNAAFLAPPGATSLAPPPPGLPPLNPNLPAIPPQPWYVRVASATNDAIWHPIDTVKRLNNQAQAAYHGWTVEEEEEHDADVDQARKAMRQREDQAARDEEARRRARPNPTTPPTTPVVPGPRAATPPTPGGPPVPGAPGYVPPAGAAGSAPGLVDTESSGLLTFNINKLNLDLTKMSAEYSLIANFSFPLLCHSMAKRESGLAYHSFNVEGSSASGYLQYTNDGWNAVERAAKKYKEMLKPDRIDEYNRQKEIYDNNLQLAELMSHLPNIGDVVVKVTIEGKEVWKINPTRSFFPFYWLPRRADKSFKDAPTQKSDKSFFIDCRYYPDEIAFILAFGGEMLGRFELIKEIYKVKGVSGILPIEQASKAISEEQARAANEATLKERQRLEGLERARVGRIPVESRSSNDKNVENPITFPYYLFYIRHFAGPGGCKWLIRTDAFVQAAGIGNQYQWTHPALGAWDDIGVRPEIHMGLGFETWWGVSNLKSHSFLYMKRPEKDAGFVYSREEVRNKVHENTEMWRKGYILQETPEGGFFFPSLWSTFIDEMKKDTENNYIFAYDLVVTPTIEKKTDSPKYLVPVGCIGTPNAGYTFKNYSERVSTYYSSRKRKIQEAMLGEFVTSYDQILKDITYEKFVNAPENRHASTRAVAAATIAAFGPRERRDYDFNRDGEIKGVKEENIALPDIISEDFFNFNAIFFGVQKWGVTPNNSKNPYYYVPPQFVQNALSLANVAKDVGRRYSGPDYRILDIVNDNQPEWETLKQYYIESHPGSEERITKGQLLGRYIDSNGVAIPIEVIPKKNPG